MPGFPFFPSRGAEEAAASYFSTPNEDRADTALDILLHRYAAPVVNAYIHQVTRFTPKHSIPGQSSLEKQRTVQEAEELYGDIVESLIRSLRQRRENPSAEPILNFAAYTRS